MFHCKVTERLWSLTTTIPAIFRIPPNVLANTKLENAEIFQLNLYIGALLQMYKRTFTNTDYGRLIDVQTIEWDEPTIRSFLVTYKNQHGYWDNSPFFN
ncbi:unnamed protein product [Ambrosiozyma monospora]|uniref:Unnamed protein product n=1 Tax=Ambrosiozyma monospora TaxID=43982 RepID=A0A9W6Z4W1_AMBMO|nr:unnamed protein product [Ambrosiozyma monospora]